ncbi:MAG TPA: DNA-processing protein DprA [Jatrophihabitans sp.]|jgi:DNA processing protein|uniref:DNA-processing protein DprA n=1 Tax=Jatrophihabitans sp. TaxID=1932789 RepID=UPI002EE76695
MSAAHASPTAAEREQLQLAGAYLSRVAEPASLPLWMFVQRHGYLAAAAAVRAGEAPAEVASCTEARRTAADPEVDLQAAQRNGIRLLTPADEDWPHFAFAALQATAQRRVAQWQAGVRARPERGEPIPPLALWVRGAGDLGAVGFHSVAVVGSRAATAYGEHIASEFSYGLAQRDVVIVSGGAYGIDAAAHRGALAAGGCSVLVSAGGLDRPYPSGHRHLYDRTAEQGLLVSERPPGSAPHRQRFLSRNRLIAAFGAATLVVEAAHRSGALNSAGHARDLGRPVLAVPGPVTSAMSAGCHRLIQRDEEPARLVTSVAEVLAYCGSAELSTELSAEPEAEADRASGASGQASWQRAYDSLDAVDRSVLDGFPGRRGSVTEAELSRLSGQPISQVIAALPVLQSLGLITVAREGYRLASVAS